MARKRVADKQQAILDAAVEVFAERGFWDTPTSLISRTAGVADGTLFNYFKTKDDLISDVYLTIKHELADQLMEGMAAHQGFRDKLQHTWNEYVDWAVENPAKFDVLQQIGTSYELSEEVRAAGMEPFADLQALASQSIALGELKEYPVEYLGVVLEGLMVATIRHIVQHPEGRAAFKRIGFEILWNGVVR